MVTGVMDPLGPARAYLRDSQRAWARGFTAPRSGSTLEQALAVSREREKAMVSDGEWVWESVFRYPQDTERRRWDKTHEILERVRPGPHEDPNYVAMLARQAAAIELCIADWGDGPDAPSNLLSRVILGTTVEPGSQGSTRLVDGCSVIEISAGLMDLFYQSAKAIVLAWKPTDPEGKGAVSFSTLPEDTEEVLDADSYPVDLLSDTLVAWLYEGRSRASYSEIPPLEYHPPLSLLINNSERFVLAHEYGHALMDQLAPSGEQVTPWDKELRADTFGAAVVAQSAATLDRLPATIALQGAVVAMYAHDILDAALQIARFGHESGSPASSSHPSFETRLSVLEEFFLTASDDAEAAREQFPGLQAPSVTLGQLWKRVAPRLRAQYRAGRRLHPNWRNS